MLFGALFKAARLKFFSARLQSISLSQYAVRLCHARIVNSIFALGTWARAPNPAVIKGRLSAQSIGFNVFICDIAGYQDITAVLAAGLAVFLTATAERGALYSCRKFLPLMSAKGSHTFAREFDD